MRTIFLLSLCILLYSCGGSTGKYEKLIADVVQTGSSGKQYDLNFKAENLEEISRITVADSIKIITDNFNADKSKKMEQLRQSLTRNEESLEKEKNSRHPGATMMAFYQKNVDQYKEQISSLEATTPAGTADYEIRDANELLAVIVRCTFSINEPVNNNRTTQTFDFVLSPDATKCYSKKRVKE